MTSGFELQMPCAFSQIDLNKPIENDGESKLSEPMNSKTPQNCKSSGPTQFTVLPQNCMTCTTENVPLTRSELLKKLHSRLKTCTGKKSNRDSQERLPVYGGTMPENIFEKLVSEFTEGILRRKPAEDRASIEKTIREVIRKINKTFKRTDLKKLMKNPNKLATLINEMATELNPSFSIA